MMERKQYEVPTVVIVDVFERGSGVPAGLLRLGARVTVEPLAAGDYRIAGGVLTDRFQQGLKGRREGLNTVRLGPPWRTKPEAACCRSSSAAKRLSLRRPRGR